MIHCPYVQLLIYLLCHPSWEVRKVAYDATKKVLSSSSGLAEDLLFLFADWLSLVGERLSILKQGYACNSLSSRYVVTFSSSESSEFAHLVSWHFSFSISDVDSSSDSQLPFIPSTEVLIKCLFLIAPYAVVHSLRSYPRLILCSHHPCISCSSSPAGVYKVWILLDIFCWIIFMSDWFHQISEVAEKVETRTDCLCWLNYSQHLCYLQGDPEIWNFLNILQACFEANIYIVNFCLFAVLLYPLVHYLVKLISKWIEVSMLTKAYCVVHFYYHKLWLSCLAAVASLIEK